MPEYGTIIMGNHAFETACAEKQYKLGVAVNESFLVS
jgi:hypothetical protein